MEVLVGSQPLGQARLPAAVSVGDRGTPGIRNVAGLVPARAEGRASTDPRGYGGLVLLGRGPLCAAIDATLGAARDGVASGLLLLGEAGIGKSALLAYAEQQAADMLVLRAEGIETETHLTWAGLHSLLRPRLEEVAALPNPQQEALRSALGLEESPNRGPFLVSAAVMSLLGLMAERRPILVLVDDIQWMDRESVDALAFALRRFDADHVAVIFACRDTEPDAPDVTTLPEQFVRLVIPPLDDTSAAELLNTRLPLSLDHRVRRRIAEAARGNPLALTELSAENAISDLEGGLLPLATRLEQGFLRRVRRLPEGGQVVLLLAAADDSDELSELLVAGAQFGVGEPEVLVAHRSRLVTLTGHSVQFSHPLVRSAVYRDAGEDLRRRAHLAWAEATVQLDPARSIWHRAAAATTPDEALAADLEGLGAEAQRRAAMDTSAQAYRRSAEVTSDVARRVRCLTSAAEATWEIGNSSLAAELVGSARALASSEAEVARVEHLRGRIQMQTGVVLEGFEILYAGACAASAHLPNTAAAMLVDAYRAASFEGIDVKVRQVGMLAQRLTDVDDPPLEAAFVAGVAHLWDRQPAKAAPLLQLVMDRSEQSSDPAPLVWASMASMYLGDNEAGLLFGTRAAVLAREHGALGTLASALEMVSFADLPLSLARAEASATEGLQAARETAQTPSVAMHLGTLSTIAAYRGAEAHCHELTERVFALARRHGLAFAEGKAVAALGLLDLALGRPELAMDRLARLLETNPHPVIRLIAATDLVEAATRADHHERAADAAGFIADWGASSGLPSARAIAARCDAMLAPPDRAIPLFEQSLAMQAGHGETLGLARTHLLVGEVLRRERRRSQARPHLRSAWEVFDRLGAHPWAERARAELRATGESAQPRGSTHDALTPQERHIAQLVAGGASSKQVAAQLFLSPRTVDYHLRKVFIKTGISSRTQLRGLDLDG